MQRINAMITEFTIARWKQDHQIAPEGGMLEKDVAQVTCVVSMLVKVKRFLLDAAGYGAFGEAVLCRS